jgi:hypothetical protein
LQTKLASLILSTRRRIADLLKGNLVKIKKNGRKNVYKINGKMHLKLSAEKACSIEWLFEFIKKETRA